MTTIHTIGDSHSKFGWKDIKDFPVHINHIGPKLMYTFGKEGEKLISNSFYQSIKPNDVLVYCFGEIDCRCHIIKHVCDTRSFDVIIDEITHSYVSAILRIKMSYLCKDAISAVYSVTPPIKLSETIDANTSEFPFLGSDNERLKFYKYMNKRLRSLCADNKLLFFDVSGEYENDEGFLNITKSDRICHINDPSGIIKVANMCGLIHNSA